MLDLEDAVPPAAKERARRVVAGAPAERPARVRINALRAEAEHARSLGFLGKSAIHPRQLRLRRSPRG